MEELYHEAVQRIMTPGLAVVQDAHRAAGRQQRAQFGERLVSEDVRGGTR